MEELEPDFRGVPNQFGIDPFLLGYNKDLVTAHYMGLEKLEEEFYRNANRRRMIRRTRKLTIITLVPIAIYVGVRTGVLDYLSNVLSASLTEITYHLQTPKNKEDIFKIGNPPAEYYLKVAETK